MADVSKAEKIAAARRRLKEHQQKSRDTAGSTLRDAETNQRLTGKAYEANQIPTLPSKSDVYPELKLLEQYQEPVTTVQQSSNGAHMNSEVPLDIPIVDIFQNGPQITNNSLQSMSYFGTEQEAVNLDNNRKSPQLEARSFFDNFSSPAPSHDQHGTHSFFRDYQPFPSEYNQQVEPAISETMNVSHYNNKENIIGSTTDSAEISKQFGVVAETAKTGNTDLSAVTTTDALGVFGDSNSKHQTMLIPELANNASQENGNDYHYSREINNYTNSTSEIFYNDKSITLTSFANAVNNFSSKGSTEGGECVNETATTLASSPELALNEDDTRNVEMPQQQNSPRSTSENIRQLSMQVHGLISESYQATPTENANELEARNQELAGFLEIERQKTEQMRLQLMEYQSRLSEARADVSSAGTEAEARARQELVPLQEQLQAHVKTIGILVAEKTELQATLAQCQSAAKLRASEVEELQGRLKASRHRVGDLEKEVASLQSSSSYGESLRLKTAADVDRLQLELRQITERKQELEDERDEINHRLSSKTAECSTVAQELFETRTQLSLAQLRVNQLSSPENEDITKQLEDLHNTKVNLEQQVASLEATAKAVTSERDDAARHYQQYVSTLDARVHSLTDQQRALADENRRLAEREASLVQHVEQLERRLQESPVKVEAEGMQQALADMEARLVSVEEEKRELLEQLQQKLTETEQWETDVASREARIEELEVLLRHLQSDQPDQARLLASMESDKVAASRAVAQNNQLKQELEELQSAFIKLSDCKLDLTDKLEHERHVTADLRLRVDMYQAGNEELRTRLSEASSACDHRHEAGEDASPISDIVTRELAQTKERIEALTVQNNELRTMLARQPQAVDRATEEHEEAGGDEVRAALEEKFRETMLAVAELTDEKQRLEHLVLQLQGETETIGEYITLYQKQRQLLCQRADEKDSQLKSLAQDREEMRAKLSQLNKLIQRLVAERGADATDDVLRDLDLNGQLAELAQGVEKPEEPDTANKIMALLTEIGSSNLVEPQQLVEQFHPCPWCSGRLITV